MLKHHLLEPTKPRRVVILGAGGFVGGQSAQLLEQAGVDLVKLGRPSFDLLKPESESQLRGLLKPEDSLVIVSAKAPCKNLEMLIENLRMFEPIVNTLAHVMPAHVVYISSDAVYADSPGPLTESSPAQPASFHGVMHLAREVALLNTVKAPLALLRPTLIYGAADPHNGYGPNRFRRLASEGKEIVLFGEGEERRDHVLVNDVAELVRRVLFHRSEGALNCVSGQVHSFKEIAEAVVALEAKPVPIRGTPRSGPMPHNGHRPFDNKATRDAFPDFRYTPLAEGLKIAKQGAA